MRIAVGRLSILVLCASVPLVVCAAARAPAAPPSAEQALRPILAGMVRAGKTLDTARFMAPFVHAPSLVFAINGRLIRGWKTLYAQQLKWWRHGKGRLQYRQTGPTEFMNLAPGVEITTWHLYARYVRANGKAGGSPFVVTYVWKRLPQGWRIVYGHESWAKPPG